MKNRNDIICLPTIQFGGTAAGFDRLLIEVRVKGPDFSEPTQVKIAVIGLDRNENHWDFRGYLEKDGTYVTGYFHEFRPEGALYPTTQVNVQLLAPSGEKREIARARIVAPVWFILNTFSTNIIVCEGQGCNMEKQTLGADWDDKEKIWVVQHPNN